MNRYENSQGMEKGDAGRMKTKVHIQMFGTPVYYDVMADKHEFKKMLYQFEIQDLNFFYITDLNTNKEVAVNPKYVAYIEFNEVKE